MFMHKKRLSLCPDLLSIIAKEEKKRTQTQRTKNPQPQGYEMKEFFKDSVGKSNLRCGSEVTCAHKDTALANTTIAAAMVTHVT
jgi:hypothetical protein